MPDDKNDSAGNADKPGPKGFSIKIDRAEYTVHEEKLSGAQLRQLPTTPIPPDRDLFQVIPGHDDLKIKDDDTVQMSDGLRFFTAPNTINPGASAAGDSERMGRL